MTDRKGKSFIAVAALSPDAKAGGSGRFRVLSGDWFSDQVLWDSGEMKPGGQPKNMEIDSMTLITCCLSSRAKALPDAGHAPASWLTNEASFMAHGDLVLESIQTLRASQMGKRKFTLTAVLAGFALATKLHAVPPSMPNLDFTKGRKIPEEVARNYPAGATGARGWIDGDNLTTTQARARSSSPRRWRRRGGLMVC